MVDPIITPSVAASLKSTAEVAVTAIGAKAAGDAVDEAKAQAMSFLEAWRLGEAVGIGNPANVSLIKAARKSNEYRMLASFTPRPRRGLLALGIGLRFQSKDGALVERVRGQVIAGPGIGAWHFAEAVQHGIMLLVHTLLTKQGKPPEVIEARMKALLGNVDRHVSFVHQQTNLATEPLVQLTKIKTSWPFVYVIAGSGRSQELAAEVAKEVARGLPEYGPERHEDEWRVAFVFFPL